MGLGALAAGLIWGSKRYQLHKNGVPVKGTVVELEASVPGGAPSVFLAPVAFDPGRVQGKPVEVYVDPRDKDAYYVHLDPLFSPGED